jgi:hypothetical protein
MDEHELRPAVARGGERERSHRENALRKAPIAPCLHDPPPMHEIDIDAGDVAFPNGKRAADLRADARALSRDRGVLARVGQQLVNRGRIGLELHTLLDGLAHGWFPPR